MTTSPTRGAVRIANVVGTGLVGGSIGMALRRGGWTVSGVDVDGARAERALELGALDSVGLEERAEITFVATPVRALPDAPAVRSDGEP